MSHFVDSNTAVASAIVKREDDFVLDCVKRKGYVQPAHELGERLYLKRMERKRSLCDSEFTFAVWVDGELAGTLGYRVTNRTTVADLQFVESTTH